MNKKKLIILFIQITGSIVGILLELFVFVKIIDQIGPKRPVQNVFDEMIVDYYIAGDELNIRLAYYDYEAKNPDWVENGKGELWQGWITVNIDDIREFLYGNGSDYLIKEAENETYR